MYQIRYIREEVLSSNKPQTPLMSSSQAYKYLMAHCFDPKEMWREKAYALFLGAKNDVIGQMLVSVGGFDQTVFDVKLILKAAIDCNAVAVVLAHNHPTGDSKPSLADINKTNLLRSACSPLSIKLLDHLIVCENEFFSFQDEVVKKTSAKKTGVVFDNQNPLSVPDLDKMYYAVRDYVHAYQGEERMIDTDDTRHDIIWALVWDADANNYVEHKVTAVRVNAEGRIEIRTEAQKRWSDIRCDSDIRYVATLFAIAEYIREYTE